ncbi:unnamed protein product [Musa acuminata subsp. burmannicoides]
MTRYTDGEDWYDCTEFEGILFTVTADEKVAIVDVLPAAEVAANDKAELQHPTVVVIVMETETYYDGSTEACMVVVKPMGEKRGLALAKDRKVDPVNLLPSADTAHYHVVAILAIPPLVLALFFFLRSVLS